MFKVTNIYDDEEKTVYAVKRTGESYEMKTQFLFYDEIYQWHWEDCQFYVPVNVDSNIEDY